jgi:EAL domain-containing protein (putative c-di-GMP-specific phosphodiesterase class I)
VIAVNVSAIQFKRGDIEACVRQALEESGLPPHCLELELTESILIHDTDQMLDTVQRLKALGVMLSIDDFGTGYSSLSYLTRFKVDKLKIDRSFVHDIEKQPGNASMVKAIIQMALSLNLKTIAEGVEDEELVGFLRRQHCEEAQGYYYSRPLPAIEFAHYLALTRARDGMRVA